MYETVMTKLYTTLAFTISGSVTTSQYLVSCRLL